MKWVNINLNGVAVNICQGLVRCVILIKKRLQHRFFPVNFAIFQKIPPANCLCYQLPRNIVENN